MPISPEIRGQKYISLTTFRKSGVGIPTPVWFGESNEKLYVMTRGTMGKTKRIRNNPKVKVAPCTIRGKVTGPEFNAVARILPAAGWPGCAQRDQSKIFYGAAAFNLVADGHLFRN